MQYAWSGSNTLPKQVSDIQQRLNTPQKDYLFAAIIRLNSLFDRARTKFKADLFDPTTEAHYVILWKALLQTTVRFNNKPPDSIEQYRSILELEAADIANSSPSSVIASGALDGLFSDDDKVGLIDWIFDQSEDSFEESYCQQLLEKFLTERTVYDPLKKYLDALGRDAIPTDINKILDEVKANQDSINSSSVSPITSVDIDDWSENAIQQVPSNVAFIDAATDGGPAKGEVLIILGPTGGGKTLTGIQLAVEGARYQVRLKESDQESGCWYYFTYECPVKPDIRQRVISCAAKIHWGSIKLARSLNDLSTTGNLKEYELKKWKEKIDANIPVPGERERYKAAMSELGDRLQLVDMSGAISPSIGTGGISEIAQVLRQGVSKGLPPVGIVIDYAGIVVERMMASRNEKVDNEFAHLNRFVNNVRVEIASQFNIVTWVLHQLHGEAGASSPATRQHHSKARGARNFADNSNFAFNIGTKDLNNNCCLITCTKSRRAESMKDPPIVFMDGAFNMMIPADGKFALDVSQRRIVDKETINAVVDPAAISGVISKKPKTNIINGAGRFIREL